MQEKAMQSTSYMRLMSKYLSRQGGRVAVLAALILSGMALQLAGPQILRTFIDSATSGKPLDALMFAAAIYIAVALFNQLVGILTTYISEKVGWTATNALREDLVSHCLKLDMEFHKEHLPGEMIERIDGDTTALSNLFTKFTVTVLANLLLIIGMAVLLLREDLSVGGGMSLFAVIALLVLLRVQSLAVPHWVKLRKARAEFYGMLGEQVSSVDEICANGAIPYAMNRFYSMQQLLLKLGTRASFLSYSMWMTTIVAFTAGYALVFGLGWHLWSQGRMTIGTVYLIFTYISYLDGPIEQVREQLEDLQKSSASIRRISDLLSQKNRVVDGVEAPLEEGALLLEVQGVSFSYAEDQQVLEDLNLKLEPGMVLGVLGRTGSGKTTITRLLNRFYDPDEGRVLFNGRDLRSIPLESLRRRITYVTQDVQLLKASVRDNLTFFDASLPDWRLVEVLEAVGLGEWLGSIPGGLDAQLAAEGAGLSAGQSQLLALARAFLREPGFVILDEASSRLDPVTERHMEGAMDKLLAGRTAMIIAHRIKTLDRADKILILNHGKILEYGRREDLARNPESQYARLLKGGMEDMLS